MADVEFPKKLQCLFDETKRYIVLYGGRGAGRSWGVARALLLRGAQKPLRILCCREYMTSLRDSVHQLLQDQIQSMGLQNFYNVQTSQIVGKNGTTFGFLGLKHNAANVKSWEGADIAWCEESHNISKNSFDLLIPTIRKDGSQIILTFNPVLAEDECYARFVENPPSDAIVMKMTYADNPFFPMTLVGEMEECKRRDPVGYENIWLGNPKAAIEGAIFARELEAATVAGRITEVEHNPRYPVHTFWDLGHSDQTAIWFIQIVGMEYHAIHYYANSQEKMHHYLHYIQQQPYNYGTHFLPHDADHEQLGQEATITQQAQDTLGSVEVVPRVRLKAHAIDQARLALAITHIDKDGCSDGLTTLRRYAFKKNEETGKISKEPEHNIYSHGADAWMTFGTAIAEHLVSSAFNAPQIPGYVPQHQFVPRNRPRLG